MRTAIVHYWLLNTRGGEKVVEALCGMLPEADLFTLFYDPGQVSETIRSRHVTASFLNPLRRHYRSLLPLMPLALESFDLRGYDLVVSSESGPAKGVLLPSTARHVCYCHTPMRYLWDLYPAYRNDWTASRWKRALITPVANYLRVWDYSTAARVDEFVANSENVARRIWKTYRREARVIHPPVAVESFYWKQPQDYFLIVSELVAYKRIDMAVRVFSKNGRRLRVVGQGPEYGALKRMARSNVEFCGRVSDQELREMYASSRALLLPGEEDFGMTAVEALASGKPVIALARGGVLESVPTGGPVGGVLYTAPSDEELALAVEQFERIEKDISAAHLQAWAQRFRKENFIEQMTSVLFPPAGT
ncbi:MAG: glycosyl transferase, group 1 [Bryobacterales bacterium]|nr:glycosyl transferase, group 1 [Bryobacterales bacterium]